MTDSTIDGIVIIGGGHNGLVCAAYLAKGGQKSHRAGSGGPGRRRGRHARICTRLQGLLRPSAEPAGRQHQQGTRAGVEWPVGSQNPDLNTIALAADGNHITIRANGIEGAGLSSEDKAAYTEYRRFMSKFAAVIGGLHNQVPPRITQERGDLITARQTGIENPHAGPG